MADEELRWGDPGKEQDSWRIGCGLAAGDLSLGAPGVGQELCETGCGLENWVEVDEGLLAWS